MDNPNYGIQADYDRNDPKTKIVGKENQKPNLKGVEAIIAEEVIKNNSLEINLYKQYHGDDKYIKSNTYNVPLTGYEDLKLADLLNMSCFFPAKHLHIEQMPDYLLGYTAIGSPNIFRNARLIQAVKELMKLMFMKQFILMMSLKQEY